MGIKIGEEHISERQLRVLRRIRHYLEDMPRNRAVAEYTRSLERLLHDTSIQQGREYLHTEWISLYEQYKDAIDTTLSGHPRLGNLKDLFDGLDLADSAVAAIDIKDERIAFLLGAGASKPEPSNIPTVTELLPDLLQRARRLDREQVTQLANFCNSQNIDNIEDLLTAVQIADFCSRNPEILRLLEFQLFGNDYSDSIHRRFPGSMRTDVSAMAYLQDTLQVLFALLSNLMLPADPNAGHEAIVDYLQDFPNTSVVTTNYDCCMDRALINRGVDFSYTMEFANSKTADGADSLGIPLIKLHGSLNWFYCVTCQDVRMIDIRQTVDNYKDDYGEYPIISVCIKCGGQRKVLLIPPHAMKFDAEPPLQPLTADAADKFGEASLIVVVGFSFADADSYISRMLIKAMQSSDSNRLIISDPDREVVDKVRRKFGAQIPNFDPMTRILHLRGDCAITLPRFLDGKAPHSTSDSVEDASNVTGEADASGVSVRE